MQWINHSELRGTHALLSPSNPSWSNYDIDQLHRVVVSREASVLGTAIHEFAEECIRQSLHLRKSDDRLMVFSLRQRPEVKEFALREMDISLVFENVRDYVNDAISFGLDPEVPLYFNKYAFGTADAINYTPDGVLRIHDLKTGSSPVHMCQLITYAAIFCYEYKVDPFKLKEIELRIYQTGQNILVCNPDPQEIADRIELIKADTKYIEGLERG